MLSVIYAKCHKIGLYAECHYTECRYAECRGAHAVAAAAAKKRFHRSDINIKNWKNIDP